MLHRKYLNAEQVRILDFEYNVIRVWFAVFDEIHFLARDQHLPCTEHEKSVLNHLSDVLNMHAVT